VCMSAAMHLPGGGGAEKAGRRVGTAFDVREKGSRAGVCCRPSAALALALLAFCLFFPRPRCIHSADLPTPCASPMLLRPVRRVSV